MAFVHSSHMNTLLFTSFLVLNIILMVISIDFTLGATAFYIEPRTITQACRCELHFECPERDVECFSNNIQSVKSKICRSWIEARNICVKFIREVKGCEEDKHRECIRSTPKEELPSLCVESSYYNSLYRYLPRQFNE